MTAAQLFAYASCAGALLSACSSSEGGSVGRVTSAPTAPAVVSSLAPNPSASASESAGAMTDAPSATPTATATASASTSTSTTCPTSALTNQTFTWTLNNSALTIAYPPYDTWTLTASIPASSPASTVVTVSDSQNDYDAAPMASTSDPAYGLRTKDFYATFSANNAITFATAGKPGPIALTFVSTCIASGTTYYLDLFENGAFVDSTSAVATSGQVVVNMNVLPNPLASGLVIDSVLSH